jgi:predicted PP-loop superfamily ATPase
VRHEARRRAAAGDEIIEQAKKRDALVTVEHGSPLIEEYHRRAAEDRRLADTHGVSRDERDGLLEVERRWSSLIILGNPAAILRKTERETP